ncbi:MAG: adenosylcobinamide-phosphate synthase CbiB [Pseudomonadota bacterium]
MTAVSIMLLAWMIEVGFGWPDWVFKRIRHPVVWIGALISVSDQRLNRVTLGHRSRYVAGACASLFILAGVTSLAIFIARLLPDTWWGWILEAAIASSLLASRSLYEHVRAVARPLQRKELDTARRAVSQIVGRTPDQMDAPEISRAGLESLAENMSDGVVAPIFWGAIFGLPGLAAYKTINTLDSMIGHRRETHAAFGGFAARLDDVANFVPARLTACLLALASARGDVFKTMFRDAGQHRSPNAGWPEAAMAGALQIRLSGPRMYGEDVTQDPWLNAACPDPAPDDMNRGLTLYVRALGLLAGLLFAFIIGERFAST